MAQPTKQILFVLAFLFFATDEVLGENATSIDGTLKAGDELLATVFCYFFPGMPGGVGGNGNNFPPLPPAGGNPGANPGVGQPGINQPGLGGQPGFPNNPGINQPGIGGQPNFPNGQPNFPNGQPNFPGQQFGQPMQPGNQLGFAPSSMRNLPVQRNSLVQRQFSNPNEWYNDWYARFQPIYMRLTQKSEKTSRNLAAANYANNVRVSYVNNAGSYLSQPGNAPELFMKNLETRLNALGTSNFPAEWKQETCGTVYYYHLCGRMTR